MSWHWSLLKRTKAEQMIENVRKKKMLSFSRVVSVLVLICVGLLAFHPQEACGSRLLADHPMLVAPDTNTSTSTSTNTMPTDNKGSPALGRTIDPSRSSKRKVRRGSDPIHNRT